MDHRYCFILWSPMVTKRFLWILAMIFAAVFLVQFFKLPYDSVLTVSLLSDGKVAFFGKRNYTYPRQEVESNKELGFVNNESSSQDFFRQHTSSNLEKVRQQTGGISPENANIQTEYLSSSPGQKTNSTSVPESLSVAITPVVSVETSRSSNEKMPLEGNLTLVNNTHGTNLSLSQGIMSETISAVSISQMDELLLESQSSPKSKPPLMYSAVDEELFYAKSEIENAPLVHRDSGLYEPLYRNISRFKRSYELMDKMLRVYIYKEGEKPIFHESIIEGIYASEGWFLKLLESNKLYVTEDPTKAHLFYLPFSSRLLQLTLYVRSSHSRKNLIEYMKNYVEMLIQKHPFWNRTNGEDHFLAACHDWAPAETRGRMLSCLRALCNADIKTGFVISKDVSLPTVYVRSAKNPLKDLGGEVARERPILAFFAGYMHGNVRPTLLKYWGEDPDMKILGRMPHVKGNKNYIQYMKSSKYCICARGYAVHSPRVVESIYYECVPVIISDNYVPPFFEVLNWKSFAVFVLEEDIPDLKKILMSISEGKYIEMQKGVKEVQRHFLWHAEPVKYDLFHMILHSVWYNRVFRMNKSV